jgi:flagellar basal-body rod protein FlgC
MSMFNNFTINGSGMYANRKWMDALSDNIANINTVVSTDQGAFQERFVQVQSANVNGSGGGVQVAGVQYGSSEGLLRHDPTHPLADENGYVRAPDMNLADQMTGLIAAQRGYQANAAAIQRAKDAYQAALGLGR